MVLPGGGEGGSSGQEMLSIRTLPREHPAPSPHPLVSAEGSTRERPGPAVEPIDGRTYCLQVGAYPCQGGWGVEDRTWRLVPHAGPAHPGEAEGPPLLLASRGGGGPGPGRVLVSASVLFFVVVRPRGQPVRGNTGAGSDSGEGEEGLMVFSALGRAVAGGGLRAARCRWALGWVPVSSCGWSSSMLRDTR